MTLGSRLRDLRVADPYVRPREMAAAVGVPFPEWSQIEADRVKPSPELVWKAAIVLGAEAEYGDPICLLDAWVEAPPIDLSRSICDGRRTR
jgi:transcriptional regulator with XRE-family HTH domain